MHTYNCSYVSKSMSVYINFRDFTCYNNDINEKTNYILTLYVYVNQWLE